MVGCQAPHRQALPCRRRYYELTRQPLSLPPPRLVSLVRRVLAGCCQPLLEKRPSRRYLHESFSGCLDPYPGGPQGAWLVSSPEASAFPVVLPGRRPPDSVRRLQYGGNFGAAVIRFASGLRICLPSRSLPPQGLKAPGRPGRCRSGPPPAVASKQSEPANRPNRAIDDVGTRTPPDSRPCRLLKNHLPE